MASLPVFCDSCGAIFFTSSIVGGSGVARVSFTNVSVGPCPACNGIGHVPDGVYDFVDNAVQWLTGPGTSLAQLRRLEAILRAVQARQKSAEDARAEVERELPQLKDWFERHSGLAGWLNLLLAVLIPLLAWQAQGSRAQAPPTTSAEEVVKRAAERPPPQLAPSHDRIGRNDPCYCGSGKKYKRCHGAVK